uniref:Uncharacterized protein n=1 Tax=Arundo donax TaxID=35708 RepID=A0A0A9AX41_ARUDO
MASITSKENDRIRAIIAYWHFYLIKEKETKRKFTQDLST